MTGAAAPYVVLASAAVLFAEALRRRAGVPVYVHAIALSVAAISAIVLWRGGALTSSVVGNSITLLLPPAAVYFFFFRIATDATDRHSHSRRRGDGHVHDRDV